jgi:hypothetical protein
MKQFLLAIVLAPAILCGSGLTPGADAAGASREAVEAFVCRHHIHGISQSDAEARALGSDAIPHLLEILADAERTEYWVNVIVVLGFLEDSQALPPLMAFLEGAEGEVDVHAFRALLSVPFAIGCIARNGDPEALDYLTGHASLVSMPEAAWTFRTSDIPLLLVEHAAIGLAMSGRVVARGHLERLNAEADRSARPERERLQGLVRETLDTQARIEADGLAAYYAR